jgi:8-oxo-dGTP pyrophosphatase MutT (NUDIX family)
MNLGQGLHRIQKDILLGLLLKPRAHFSQLNKYKDEVTSDLFNFHIKRLSNQGYIEKKTDGYYYLTDKGKQYAGLMDTKNATLETQAKISVAVCGVRQSNNKIQYLIQQRLKQPYYGYYGLVGGKVKRGETALEAVNREFYEETNLKGELELIWIEHKMDYSQKGDILDDKIFFFYKATNFKGKLMKNFSEGKNQWLSESEIIKLDNVFEDVPIIIEKTKHIVLEFSEIKYKVKGF